MCKHRCWKLAIVTFRDSKERHYKNDSEIFGVAQVKVDKSVNGFREELDDKATEV